MNNPPAPEDVLPERIYAVESEDCETGKIYSTWFEKNPHQILATEYIRAALRQSVPGEVLEKVAAALRSCQIQSGYCHESGGEVGEYWYDDEDVTEALTLLQPYLNNGRGG